MKLTEQELLQKRDELQKIEIELDATLREQRVAKEFGDASENAELEIATQKALKLQKQKFDLEEQLSDYEIVEPDNGPRIQLGNHVSIQKINEDGEPLEEPRLFVIANSGTTYDREIDQLLHGFSKNSNDVNKENILGVNSTLCTAILNGTSGIFEINTEKGVIRYNVIKEV